MKSLIVLGGGITGLVAAYVAAKAGRCVTVLEAGAQAGGLLSTFPIASTRLEHYYHHFFTHDAELHWLVRELGLESQLRYLPGSMGIYRNGAIYGFNGPRDLLGFHPLGLAAKGRFAASSMYLAKMADWRAWEDVPCLQWFETYAGREATNSIWRPMLEIKFGPYADRVPAAWMVGRLRQRLNSRRRDGERLGYLEGSLDILLRKLLEALATLGVRVLTQHPVQAIDVRAGRVVGVKTQDRLLEADDVLATVPADRFASIVCDADAAYAKDLRRIEHFGAVCTVLEMDRPLGPYYWLNVADPGFPFGGVIEHTRLVPPVTYDGRHIVYLSRYFERGNDLESIPEADIAEAMINGLSRIYPGFQQSSVIQSHVFRTRTAAVVCDLGFSSKVPAIETPIAGLFYAGMVHVYPDERSVNNSIRVAAEGLHRLGCDTSHIPRHASLSGQIG
jgi:protoporphyrinogen oxidase